MPSSAKITWTLENHCLYCHGDWTTEHTALLSDAIEKLKYLTPSIKTIDAQGISAMDSTGAWLLITLIKQQAKQGKPTPQLMGLADQQKTLYQLVASKQAIVSKIPPPSVTQHSVIYLLGLWAIKKWRHFIGFIRFFGEIAVTLIQVLSRPHNIQWRSVLVTLDQMGAQALPIIALVSFLIGVVLTYQAGLKLQNYGANIFIVDLSGLALLREFGPLISAIITAGRTSTAFSSHIGMMSIKEEIDALLTMGLSPIELLALPRTIGLIIALPLVTVWANIFGILGSMVMSRGMLQIHYADFLIRFQNTITLKDYLVGLVKAPIFALVIATVGCYQGFQVSNSAANLGKRTTFSAVQSLFLIVMIDALFSVFLSMEGI